jgi:hypothetical protein
MDMVTNFTNETQMTQTECCFDIAMNRVRKDYGNDVINKLSDEGMESFQTKLWNSIARTVIVEGYEAAKEYASNTCFAL